MIKVITPGDFGRFITKTLQTKTFMCAACGCMFDADKEDYRKFNTRQGYFGYLCECPCCKSEVTTF